MLAPFVIVRDYRGSLVHVRRRDDGECVGCIEVGLYEIVRSLVFAETTEIVKMNMISATPAVEMGDTMTPPETTVTPPIANISRGAARG